MAAKFCDEGALHRVALQPYSGYHEVPQKSVLLPPNDSEVMLQCNTLYRLQLVGEYVGSSTKEGRAFVSDTVNVDEVPVDHDPADTDTLLYMFDGHAVQVELPASANIAAQHEAGAIAQEHAGLLDSCSDRGHRGLVIQSALGIHLDKRRHLPR